MESGPGSLDLIGYLRRSLELLRRPDECYMIRSAVLSTLIEVMRDGVSLTKVEEEEKAMLEAVSEAIAKEEKGPKEGKEPWQAKFRQLVAEISVRLKGPADSLLDSPLSDLRHGAIKAISDTTEAFIIDPETYLKCAEREKDPHCLANLLRVCRKSLSKKMSQPAFPVRQLEKFLSSNHSIVRSEAYLLFARAALLIKVGVIKLDVCVMVGNNNHS